MQIANKHAKRCPTSCAIRQMQFKIMGYHYTPIRMAKLHNTDITECWGGCGAIGILINLLVRMQNDLPTLVQIWQFLTKLEIPLPCNPANIVFGIYPKELKIYVFIKICIQIFVAALFIIAKI